MVWPEPEMLTDDLQLKASDSPVPEHNPANHIASPGDIAMHVEDACGAPGGWRVWLDHVVSITSLQPRFSPFERLSELEAVALDVDESEWRPVTWRIRWRARLAWARYIYLVRHLPARRVYRAAPPSNLELRRLWDAREKAYAAYCRAAKRYVAAAGAFSGAEVSSEGGASRRGRIGNPALREAVASLLPLYAELFGVEPTITHGGPAVRFVCAALSNIGGEWLYQPARDFEPDNSGRALLIVTRAPPIRQPTANAIRDMIRAVKAFPPERPRAFGDGDGILVNGYFDPVGGGGEKWGPSWDEMPPLFRLPQREILP